MSKKKPLISLEVRLVKHEVESMAEEEEFSSEDGSESFGKNIEV